MSGSSDIGTSSAHGGAARGGLGAAKQQQQEPSSSHASQTSQQHQPNGLNNGAVAGAAGAFSHLQQAPPPPPPSNNNNNINNNGYLSNNPPPLGHPPAPPPRAYDLPLPLPPAPPPSLGLLGSNGLPQSPGPNNHLLNNVNIAAAAAAMSRGPGGPGVGNGTSYPSTGEQMDMQVLWDLISNIAEVQQGIREQTQGVLQRVQIIQQRGLDERSNGNVSIEGHGEANGASPDQSLPESQPQQLSQSLPSLDASTSHPASAASSLTSAKEQAYLSEIASLRSQLTSTESHLSTITSRSISTWHLLSTYESSLTSVLSKLRPFAASHAAALAAQKAHYLHLLEHERSANLDLRMDMARTQEGLARALDAARLALATQNDASRPWARRCAKLRAENRVLASVCGVPCMEEAMESEESSDEEDDERGGGAGGGNPGMLGGVNVQHQGSFLGMGGVGMKRQ